MTNVSVGRACAAGLCVALLVACAQRGPAPLYMWESFPRQQYDFLLRAGASPADQIVAMEAHAEKARAGGAKLPPGFRAHLGMLKGSAGDFNQARELWQAEKAAYPESTPYMDRLLQRMEAPSKKENPT